MITVTEPNGTKKMVLICSTNEIVYVTTPQRCQNVSNKCKISGIDSFSRVPSTTVYYLHTGLAQVLEQDAWVRPPLAAGVLLTGTGSGAGTAPAVPTWSDPSTSSSPWRT